MKKQYEFDELDEVEQLHASEIGGASPETADDFAEQVVDDHYAARYGAPQSSVNEWLRSEPDAVSEVKLLLVQRQKEIEALAQSTFSSAGEAHRWFNTRLPVALKNQTPLSAMITIEGCARVEKLLLELYS